MSVYGMMMPEDFDLSNLPLSQKIELVCEHIIRSSKESEFKIENLHVFQNSKGIGWICGDKKETEERLEKELKI